jgi:hypothetical protein
VLFIVVSYVDQAVAATDGGGRMTSLISGKQDHVLKTVSDMEKGPMQKGMLLHEEQGVSTFPGSRRLMMMSGDMSSSGSSSTGSRSSYSGGGLYYGYSTPATAADEKHSSPPMARNVAIGVVGVALVVIAATAAWMEKRVSHSSFK